MSASQPVLLAQFGGPHYYAEAHGDGPLVVARVRKSEGIGEVWSITHRRTGWAIVDVNHGVHNFDLADLEHACMVRDELLAIPNDWTAANPRESASVETLDAVRAVFAREHARRGDR